MLNVLFYLCQDGNSKLIKYVGAIVATRTWLLCYVMLCYSCVVLSCVALRCVALRCVTLCCVAVLLCATLRHLKMGALFLLLSLTNRNKYTHKQEIFLTFKTFPWCCSVCFLFFGTSQKALCHYICLCRSKLTRELKESKESLREIQRKLAHQSAVSRFKPFHSQDRNANSPYWLLWISLGGLKGQRCYVRKETSKWWFSKITKTPKRNQWICTEKDQIPREKKCYSQWVFAISDVRDFSIRECYF